MPMENKVGQKDKVSPNPVVDNYLSAKGRSRYVISPLIDTTYTQVCFWRCYEARDNYFLCLDQVEKRTGKEVADNAVDCAKEYQEYTNNCLSSWVRYFNQQRKIAKTKPQGFVAKKQSS